jgi:5-formaminoimidazole-4-carboxamide-1-beta-D-ribofuranosyl 5'-monophosphate synthetase
MGERSNLLMYGTEYIQRTSVITELDERNVSITIGQAHIKIPRPYLKPEDNEKLVLGKQDLELPKWLLKKIKAL